MSGQKAIPLLLLAGLVYLIFMLHAVLLPFFLAAAIAYTLNPLVAFLEIRGIQRRRAVVVVYLGLICVAAWLGYLGFSAAVQSTGNIAAELPVYVMKARSFMDRNIAIVEQMPLLSRLEIGAWLRERLGDGSHTWLLSVIQKAPSLLGVHLVPLLEMTLLVPFLVFFFMLDGPDFLDKILDF